MNDLAFKDRAVYVESADALVLADVHVGREEASGVELPLGEREDLHDRLERLVAQFDPERTVFAGDLLHAFGRASDAALESLIALVDVCRNEGSRPVLLVGNHDTALAEAWQGELHEEVPLGDGTVVCHGHEPPDHDASRYVVGHDHPAITVEGARHPCFLYGEGCYRDAELLLLPAFNRLAPGVEVNGDRAPEFQSPLVADIDVLRPIVYDDGRDGPLVFPPLGEFRDVF